MIAYAHESYLIDFRKPRSKGEKMPRNEDASAKESSCARRFFDPVLDRDCYSLLTAGSLNLHVQHERTWTDPKEDGERQHAAWAAQFERPYRR